MTTKAFELAQLGDTVTVSSDNVGIGTSSPVAKLQIKTQTNGNAAFQNSTSVSGGVKINAFNDAANVSVPFEIDGSSLQFNIASTERMRIDTNGNVGIACAPNSSSSGVAGLSIGDGAGPLGSLVSDGASNTETRLGHGYYFDGSNYKHETNNVGVAIYQQLGNNAGAQHIWFSNAGGSEDATFTPTERMRIDSSGNVGIGTSSPSERLHVAGLAKADSGFLIGNSYLYEGAIDQVNMRIGTDGPYLEFLDAGSNVAEVGNASGPLALTSDGTERMRIDSGGNVGIGTSSPVAKLDVVAGTDERLLFTNSSGTSLISSVNAANTAYNELYLNGLDIRFGTSLTERMRINSSGNVGIGTSSPQATAEISGGLDNRLRINSTDGTTSNNYGIDFSTAGTVRGGIRYNAGNNYLAFYGYDNTERMRINSSGNVGIGTTSVPSEARAMVSGGRFYVNSQDQYSVLLQNSGTSGGFIGTTAANTINFFNPSGTERMRIDGSGNLLVGTTDTTIYDNNSNTTADNGLNLRGDGKLDAARYNGIVLGLNLTGNDGTIVDLRKSGTTVGSIGVLSSNNVYFGSSDSGHAGLVMDGSSIVPLSALSRADNAIDLGEPSYRFDDIYATNGTIQTSDRNEKQDIAELSDAEQRVAVAAKGLMRKFRWRDAVAEKGDDARTHFGVIAQDLQAAFAAEGLDAGDYAMFISTTWWETQTEVPAVEADEENGIEGKDAYTRTDTYNTQEEAPEGATQKTRLGVRYSELLAFIIGAL